MTWRCRTRVEKYDADGYLVGTLDQTGGVLCYGGLSLLWDQALGINRSIRPYSAGHATLLVGDGTAAAEPTDVKLYGEQVAHAGMCPDYPHHEDSRSAAYSTQVIFRSVFGAEAANFAWHEWGVSNQSLGGRLMARHAAPLGVKHAGDVWALAVVVDMPSESELAS